MHTRLEPYSGIEERIHGVDAAGVRYLLQRFGKEWSDPHPHDLMILSHEVDDLTANVIR